MTERFGEDLFVPEPVYEEATVIARLIRDNSSPAVFSNMSPVQMVSDVLWDYRSLYLAAKHLGFKKPLDLVLTKVKWADVEKAFEGKGSEILCFRQDHLPGVPISVYPSFWSSMNLLDDDHAWSLGTDAVANRYMTSRGIIHVDAGLVYSPSSTGTVYFSYYLKGPDDRLPSLRPLNMAHDYETAYEAMAMIQKLWPQIYLSLDFRWYENANA